MKKTILIFGVISSMIISSCSTKEPAETKEETKKKKELREEIKKLKESSDSLDIEIEKVEKEKQEIMNR
jgi:hypothetical protein